MKIIKILLKRFFRNERLDQKIQDIVEVDKEADEFKKTGSLITKNKTFPTEIGANKNLKNNYSEIQKIQSPEEVARLMKELWTNHKAGINFPHGNVFMVQFPDENKSK